VKADTIISERNVIVSVALRLVLLRSFPELGLRSDRHHIGKMSGQRPRGAGHRSLLFRDCIPIGYAELLPVPASRPRLAHVAILASTGNMELSSQGSDPGVEPRHPLRNLKILVDFYGCQPAR
jgi:hypothetical protein